MNFSYPKYIRFKCSRCALCCGDTKEKVRRILLLKIEAERISQSTPIDIDEFSEKIEGFTPYIYVMKKNKDGKCVFLKDRSCSIYEIRPLLCRFYPFQLERLEHNQYAFICTNECPSIGEGPYLKSNFFEKLMKETEVLMKEDQRARKKANNFIIRKDK